MFVVFVSLIHCQQAEYRAVNWGTLTTSNTSVNGATINVLHSDVTVTDQWNITTTDDIGFHLSLSVSDTWGFIDDQPSQLWIIFHNSNIDESFNDCRLLTSFSVNNSQYFTTILNPAHLHQHNQIYPNCNNDAAFGDIEQLVDSSESNMTRIQKATDNNNVHDMPIYDSSEMTDYNNSWPIYFRIKYYPLSLGNHIIVDLINFEWDSHLHCRYNKPIFPAYQGIDVYIACADIGDSLSISAIDLIYAYDLTYAPTIEPTVNPTSNPTILGSITTATTASSPESITTDTTYAPTIEPTHILGSITTAITASAPGRITTDTTLITDNPKTTVEETRADPTTTDETITTNLTSTTRATAAYISTTSAIAAAATYVTTSLTTSLFTTDVIAVTDIVDDMQYGINISLIFIYNNNHTLNANITTVLPLILNDVIEDEAMNDCVDQSYNIRVDKNHSSVFVNASIFTCDPQTQQRLFAFVSDGNALIAEVITAIADYNDTVLLIAPNDLILLSVDLVTRSKNIIETTENLWLSTTDFVQYINNQTLHTKYIYISNNDTLNIVALMMCFVLIVCIVEILYIRRFDRHHIFVMIIFALAICNLFTDIIVSYRLYIYYLHVNNDVLVFILTIFINIFIVIPYLYNIALGTYTLYSISSHLCCLLSNLLLILSGDSYATLSLVSSQLFNIQNVIVDPKQNTNIAPFAFCYYIPQIIIQSIFALYLLRYMDALLIVSILLSLIMLISGCMHTKKRAMEHIHRTHKLKIDIHRANVSVHDDTFTSINTPRTLSKLHHDDIHNSPMTPMTPMTPYPHAASDDDKSNDDMYDHYDEPEPKSTVRTLEDCIAYIAINAEDADIIESKLPELPEEKVSLYGRLKSVHDMYDKQQSCGNIKQIMITNRDLSIQVEGRQQQTGDLNTFRETNDFNDDDGAEEDALLDAILSEILKQQELDPNKIHEINANELDSYKSDSISKDSDKIYDRPAGRPLSKDI